MEIVVPRIREIGSHRSITLSFKKKTCIHDRKNYLHGS